MTSITIPDSVTSIPDNIFFNCTGLTSITIPDSVTSIGSNAFYKCSGLTSVAIPAGVTTIERNAFTLCSSLTRVDIVDLEAWCNISFESSAANPICYAKNLYLNDVLVEDITIPAGITAINNYAFYRCTGLKSVTIPDGVTTIGDYAFSNCTGLTSITIPASVTTIGESAFHAYAFENVYLTDLKAYMDIEYTATNSRIFAKNIYLNNELLTNVEIPEGVTTIPSYIFYGNTSITKITIPDTVTTISDSAFFYCSSLKSITIPAGVTTIGDAAFCGCDNLSSIYITDLKAYMNIEFGNTNSIPTFYAKKIYLNNKVLDDVQIPDGVKKVKQYIFTGNPYITSVTIPDSVTEIEEMAFYTCENLKYAKLSENIKVIDFYTFGSTALSEIVIPDSVTTIGEGAFCLCTGLKSITIPDSVTTIGNSAFANCYAATLLVIPDSVTTIGNSAFACLGIKEAALPHGIEIINERTFWGCNQLESITFTNSVKEIEINAFDQCDKFSTIYFNGTEAEWNDVYIAPGNEAIENAAKKFFLYVTLIDADGNEISKKMYDENALVDISDIEGKFEHTIHLYTDEECTNEFDPETPVTENLVLQLRYVPNQYLAKFVDDDGTVISEKLVDYGAVITPPENPSKPATQQYTYTFAGWEGFVEGITQENKEMVFTAKYDSTVNQYTYKFTDDDGTVLKEETVDYGTVIVLPEAPDDKDPYTFDYWENYSEGMTVTDNIELKAVYKYKTYTVTVQGLEKAVDIVYNDAFVLETQVPEEEYLFAGYFTEENGKGTKVTDENGNSIVNYNFLENITVYPYFPHELLNKIKINGEDSTIVGETDIVKKVYFATDKNAGYLLCTIKYPEIISLKEIVSKDFKYVSEESKYVKDGYVYQNLICQYADNLDNVPLNKKIAPFELIFDIPTTVSPQNVTIEITSDSILIGDEDYTFDYIINGNLEIAAKPVESIEIIGDETIVLEDGDVTYLAQITPDYATNKEVIWSVSDEAVATVSADGVLTPLSAGIVTVTAAANDGSGVIAEKVITIQEYAKITSLKSDTGIWDKEFDKSIREYTVYVSEDTEKISFTPSFTSGTLTIGGSLAINNRAKAVTLSGEETNVIFIRSNASGYADGEYKINVVKFEGTKTTLSDDETTFTVNPINVEKGNAVILALYNDEEFVEMQTEAYDGNELTFTTDKAYTNANVMVWNLINLKPVCDVEAVK